MNIPIFIIHLQKSTERKLHIIRQMQALNLRYEFIEAIDGEKISDHEMKNEYKNVIFKPRFLRTRYLIKGEIGCTLSHMKLFNRMVDQNIEIACILEDDVVLNEDFEDLLKLEKIQHFEWDILMFGHHSRHRRCMVHGGECANDILHFHKDYFIGTPVERPNGTYAYMIKQQAARKLLDHAFPIQMPTDYLVGGATGLGLKLRLLTPPAAIHDFTLFHSTIRHEKIDGYINPFMILYYNLNNHIEKYFPKMSTVLRSCKRIILKTINTPVLFFRKRGILIKSYVEKLNY